MKKIIFSRHAKRRAKLYNISLADIEGIIKSKSLTSGKQTIVQKVNYLKYPLKIVLKVEIDKIIIITNYPLKKEKRK